MRNCLLLAVFLLFFQTVAGAEENRCISCHKNLTDPLQKKMYLKWDRSPHQKAGVFCNDCHGGNPDAQDKEASHKGCNFGNAALERTSPKNINDMCGNCHLSVFDEFRQSEHYRNIAKDEIAPTCGDCHFEQQGRTIDHSRLKDFCTNCHRMTVKKSDFYVSFDAVGYKELSDETKKSVATAKRMLEYQLSLDRKNVPEKNIQLARKLLTIAEVGLHNSAASWHRFRVEEIRQHSEKAYYLAQTAIDLLLPQK